MLVHGAALDDWPASVPSGCAAIAFGVIVEQDDLSNRPAPSTTIPPDDATPMNRLTG
jgi:hypothetical protein